MVSSSQLGARERDIANVLRLVSDDDVLHYWDGQKHVGATIEPLIDGLDIPAWDFWMLYEPGVRWEGTGAPTPTWWEHQLGSLDKKYRDRRLDARRFAAKAAEMAKGAGARRAP